MTSVSAAESNSEFKPQSGNGAGLLDFMTYLVDKNYMVKSTAAAMKTGVKKVLEVEEQPDALDLRDADVNEIVLRFRNRNRGHLNEKSLRVYEQRFRQATEMYIRWLADDPDWRGRRGATGGGTSAAASAKARPTAPRPNSVAPTPAADSPEVPAPEIAGVTMITYPFPIRRGVQGRITLPDNLTAREAARIARFVETLVSDDQDDEGGI